MGPNEEEKPEARQRVRWLEGNVNILVGFATILALTLGGFAFIDARYARTDILADYAKTSDLSSYAKRSELDRYMPKSEMTMYAERSELQAPPRLHPWEQRGIEADETATSDGFVIAMVFGRPTGAGGSPTDYGGLCGFADNTPKPKAGRAFAFIGGELSKSSFLMPVRAGETWTVKPCHGQLDSTFNGRVVWMPLETR